MPELSSLSLQAWLEILAAAKNTSYSEAFSVQAGLLNLLSGQPDLPMLFETFDDILTGKSPGSSGSTPGLGAVIGIPIICADTSKLIQQTLCFHCSL